MNAQLVIEHIEELALYPANIALSKDTGAECPVHVLERGVVAVLEMKGGMVSTLISSDRRPEEISLGINSPCLRE